MFSGEWRFLGRPYREALLPPLSHHGGGLVHRSLQTEAIQGSPDLKLHCGSPAGGLGVLPGLG